MRALALLLLLLQLPALSSLLACDIASVQVTTVAGGGSAFLGATPLTSSLNTPSGLATSPAGILYIADTASNAVRAMNLTSGLWLMGMWSIPAALPAAYAEGALNTTARFKAPLDVATAPCTTAVYVADSGNHAVRVLNVSARNVSTALVAGNPQAPGMLNGVGTQANFQSPLGLALAPSCATLYVTDSSHHTIRVINLATRAVTTLAGSTTGAAGTLDGIGTAALFYNPRKLALDATGTLLRFGELVRFARMQHARVSLQCAPPPLTLPPPSFPAPAVRLYPAHPQHAHACHLHALYTGHAQQPAAIWRLH